jgi:hypothetical protein
MCNIALKKEKRTSFVTRNTYGMSQMLIVLFKSNILHGGHLEILNGRQFDLCNIFAFAPCRNMILVSRGTFMRSMSSIMSF